jgi:hypothetical protein
MAAINHEGKAGPWKKSRAKEILYKDILEGTFQMHPEYQQYKKQNFRTNLKNLLKATREKQCAANSDDRALVDDINTLSNHVLHTPGAAANEPSWNNSEAKKLLEDDISNGMHLIMKPTSLWLYRDEYQAFPEDKFRNHIYQEMRRRVSTSYWLEKKKNKEKREQAEE